MREKLRVRFENGTGGLVHTITGDLVDAAIVDTGGVRTTGTVEPRLEFPPMMVLTNVRADSPATANLLRPNKAMGIAFSRIVSVEWIGGGHRA
jgi:hypothetical protein